MCVINVKKLYCKYRHRIIQNALWNTIMRHGYKGMHILPCTKGAFFQLYFFQKIYELLSVKVL